MLYPGIASNPLAVRSGGGERDSEREEGGGERLRIRVGIKLEVSRSKAKGRGKFTLPCLPPWSLFNSQSSAPSE